MRFTGMRPSEACALTLERIDRSGPVWLYRPARHITAHHGLERVIPIGPEARTVLTEFLATAGRVLSPEEPVFSPARALTERQSEMREMRKSKVQPSQISRNKTKPQKAPTEWYTPTAVSHAVALACDRAFPALAPLSIDKSESHAAYKSRLTEEQRDELRVWKRQMRWTPYQLRHSFATAVRKEHVLESAQVLRGHSRADVTQIYAERNTVLALEVAARIG